MTITVTIDTNHTPNHNPNQRSDFLDGGFPGKGGQVSEGKCPVAVRPLAMPASSPSGFVISEFLADTRHAGRCHGVLPPAQNYSDSQKPRDGVKTKTKRRQSCEMTTQSSLSNVN